MLRMTSACLCAVLCSALGFSLAAGQDRVLGVDSVRAAFAGVGYEVDAPTTWAWQAPPLTTFHVTDRRGGRILLVEVFADAAQARSEAERKAGGTRVNNVVLFQSGTRALMNESELECAPELVAAPESTAPLPVDADLLAIIGSRS